MKSGKYRNLNSSNSVLVTQGSIVVGIDYDCRRRMVYWTDVAGRTIVRQFGTRSRARDGH